MTAAGILLTPEELRAITGYQKPALQVRELHSRGFSRARVNVVNRVVLERSHYEAVCSGAAAQAQASHERPRVMPPRGHHARGSV